MPPSRTVAEVMLTIRPQPRAAIPALRAWASSIGAVTFTAKVACHSASGSTPRSTFEFLFGFGLSNKSFNGLPIDSNWLATYYDVGVVGIAINVLMLLFLLVAVCFRSQGPERALALYLVIYCVVASFTETGLSDATPYLLELTLAACLLAPRIRRRGVSL